MFTVSVHAFLISNDRYNLYIALSVFSYARTPWSSRQTTDEHVPNWRRFALPNCTFGTVRAWINKSSSACLPAAPSSEEEDVFDMNEVSERRDRIYTLVLSADEFLAVRNLHLIMIHISIWWIIIDNSFDISSAKRSRSSAFTFCRKRANASCTRRVFKTCSGCVVTCKMSCYELNGCWRKTTRN